MGPQPRSTTLPSPGWEWTRPGKPMPMPKVPQVNLPPQWGSSPWPPSFPDNLFPHSASSRPSVFFMYVILSLKQRELERRCESPGAWVPEPTRPHFPSKWSRDCRGKTGQRPPTVPVKQVESVTCGWGGSPGRGQEWKENSWLLTTVMAHHQQIPQLEIS